MTGLERLALADAIASDLRHDLRNKVAAIRNASFYLRRKNEKSELWGTDPRIATFFTLIDEQLSAVERLVNERLGAARPAEESQPVRPSELFAAALDATTVPRSVTVERELGADAPIAANPSELTLALRCLIDNAIEAMPEGGVLRLVCAHGDPPTLRVEDSGPGFGEIAPAPFATTKPGHAGLGLLLARRLARRGGGDLTLASRPEGGAIAELSVRREGAP